MSWRLRLSVETILRLTPAMLGSTVMARWRIRFERPRVSPS
jgi:hypothetical protein